MAKSKEVKNAAKAKSEVKSLSTVKNASVTKPSQTPNAKSKQIAKETATKINGKKSKKPVKEPTPEPESESDSESSAGSSDSSDSESEAEEAKPVITNGKAKTNGSTKKEVEHETSDSSDSSSEDDSDASDSDDASEKPATAADSDDSDSDSSEDEKPAAIVKTAVKKVAETGKAAVNGAAKAVAKATESSDEEDESDDSANSSEDDEEDGSDGSDSSEDDSETEAPSKKRKAEDDTSAPAKKSKTEAAGSNDGPKNLFVGNLSWNIDDEWLLREFEEFGEITRANVITDKATGRSKGFGYVEFSTGTSAAAALAAKKGSLIDGREANVDFSTPRDNAAPKDRAQNRAQQFGDSTNPPSDTLFCGNLSFGADENMIGEAFGAHGTVVNVRLPTDMDSGNPKGFGYVTFASIDECKTAYEAMVGAEIDGRPVRLDYATPRPDRNGGGGGRGGGRGGFNDRGGRGGGRGGRGGFGDRGTRGGARGGRGGSTNRGGFGDFKGKKQTF